MRWRASAQVVLQKFGVILGDLIRFGRTVRCNKLRPNLMHLAIYCGTATNHTDRHSVIASERWGSRRSSLRHDHHGKIPTLSVSSDRSAENVWITLSSPMSATCAAYYRAIFITITAPERIFRLVRTARGLVPSNFPRPAISSPSRRLAVCTIAMSAEPLRLHAPAHTPSNCRHANFEQGQGSAKGAGSRGIAALDARSRNPCAGSPFTGTNSAFVGLNSARIVTRSLP